VLGWELRKDVGYQQMRWLTVGPANQPDTSIVLTPPAVDPGISEDERRTILELMAKGSFGVSCSPPENVDAAFAEIERAGETSCRSRSTSPTGSATARSATPPAT
jgi:hypothetical protein